MRNFFIVFFSPEFFYGCSIFSLSNHIAAAYYNLHFSHLTSSFLINIYNSIIKDAYLKAYHKFFIIGNYMKYSMNSIMSATCGCINIVGQLRDT